MIERHEAVVYRGGGRRWFSLQAACNAEARAKIRTRCECWTGDSDNPYETCWHHELNRYRKLKRRLARIYVNAYRKGA